MAGDFYMNRCPKCGVPRILYPVFRWRNDGTITLLLGQTMRMAIVNSDVYHSVFSRIEEELGYSIRHLLFEAHRNISRTSFEGVLKAFPGSGHIMKWNPGKRLAVDYFHLITNLFGLSLSETLEYLPGKRGIARFKNPYHRELMAANVVGAFEFLDGRPYEYEIKEGNEREYIVEVWPSEGKPEFSKRLEANLAPTIPGEIKLPYCRRCGVPNGISERLIWISDEGRIVERHTGARMIISPMFTLTTVFRELAKELGDEVNKILVKAQRDWIVEDVGQLGIANPRGAHSLGEIHEVYRNYLMSLPLFGHGNPVFFKVEASSMEVVVENPFDIYMIAGTIQGLFEALTKEKCEVAWEIRRENMVAYTVTA